MSDTVIKVAGVSKKYCRTLKHTMLYGATDLARSFLGLNGRAGRLRKGEFWAVKDVSFELKKGECLGIIGLNGSGKSTLLKMLNGIFMPDTGSIEINGRVGALIEVGAGFHPMLTGRENIYINGAIMGMGKREIDRKFDSIVDFAGIGEFIDSPVKHYSSGMYVRLGFAIAVHCEPDILLIDEVLAVGDIKFQQKCYRKIEDFRGKGKIILLVTHSTNVVINFCKRAIWINDGVIEQSGPPSDVVKNYVSYMYYGHKTIETKEKKIPEKETIDWEDLSEYSQYSHFGASGAEIKRAVLCSKQNLKKINTLSGGEDVILRYDIEVKVDIPEPLIGFVLKDGYGNDILGLNNHFLGKKIPPFTSGERVVVDFEFQFPRLTNGDYLFSLAIAEGTQDDHVQHHWVHNALTIHIASNDEVGKASWYFIIDKGDIKINGRSFGSA